MKDKIRTFTRKDITRKVTERLDVHIQDADLYVDGVIAAMRELLMSADPEVRLEIRDFGVFEVKLTKAKPRARNPKTGARIFVPARRKSHFKPSKLLKSFLVRQLTESEMAALSRADPRRAAFDPVLHGSEELLVN